MAKSEIETEGGEILTSQEVALAEKAASGVMVGGMKFKVKELVNVPTLKHDSETTVAFTVLAPIFENKGENDNMVSVVRVKELSSGQTFEYVCNAITQDSLRSAYPNDGYVGKSFAIKKLGTVQGKRYKDVQIVEIEPA